MIPVHDLFESHLNVADLQRSMGFFGQTLGLELAEVFWDRRVAFYWIGGRGNSMLQTPLVRVPSHFCRGRPTPHSRSTAQTNSMF